MSEPKYGHYVISAGSDCGKLEQHVRQYIEDGYVPWGPVIHDPDAPFEERFQQPLISLELHWRMNSPPIDASYHFSRYEELQEG